MPHPVRPASLARAAEAPEGGSGHPEGGGWVQGGPTARVGRFCRCKGAAAGPDPAPTRSWVARSIPPPPRELPPRAAPGPAEGATARPAGLGGAARARPPGRGSPRASTCRGARGAGSPADAFIAAAAAAAAAAASSFLLRRPLLGLGGGLRAPSSAGPGAPGGGRPRRRRRRPRRWWQRRGPGNFAPLCAPPRRRRAGSVAFIILRGEISGETPYPTLPPPHTCPPHAWVQGG